MRLYTVELEVASFNAAADDGVLIIEAPADMVVAIVAAQISMDFASHETVHASFGKITTKGSLAGASTPAIAQHSTGDAASTVTTYGANADGMTAEPSTWADPVESSIQGGWQWVFEPPFDSRLILSPSELAGLRILKQPTAANMQATITFAEIGG